MATRQPNIDNMEQDIEESQKSFDLLHEYELKDMATTASTTEGRAVLWRILEVCGVSRASFTGEANHTFWREGMRKVGQEIYLMIDELPDGDELILKMQREAAKRKEELINHD